MRPSQLLRETGRTSATATSARITSSITSLTCPLLSLRLRTKRAASATPKETEYTSNIAYFGEPIYTYSLKQGIRDGFLAPYKVIKVHIDHDVSGYRPEKGQLDRDGEEVEDRLYNAKDFDRTLVIDDRTRIVARKLSRLLQRARAVVPASSWHAICEALRAPQIP